MTPLLDYFLSLTPGFLVFTALLVVVPRDHAVFRILIHIAFFILARDAMTGSGFWQIGPGSLRFTAAQPTLLFLAAISSLLFVGIFLV